MRLKIFSGYTFFGVSLLVVTLLSSFTQLTCPVCGGTGVITGAGGLKVIDVDGSLIGYKIFDTGCAEIYGDFIYDVNITLSNDTSISRGGSLLVKFYHPSGVESKDAETVRVERAEELEVALEEIFLAEEVGKGGNVITFTQKPVAFEFTFVEVPAETVKTFNDIINFSGFGITDVSGFGVSWDRHVLSVAPPEASITCPYCRGTGKVPLTLWISLKAGV